MRLQEYGCDVLVLEKEGGEKYSVVSGTPEKMVEHLLDIAAKDDEGGKRSDAQRAYTCCCVCTQFSSWVLSGA